MKIIFTWYGDRPENWRLENIKRAHKVYPDVKIICYTNRLHYFPDFVETRRIEVEARRIQKKYGINPKCLKTVWGITDYIKFALLSENKHWLYLDTDVYCLEPLKIEDEKCGAANKDIYVLYSNNKPEYFFELIESHNSKPTLVGLSENLDFENKFADISEYFKHK